MGRRWRRERAVPQAAVAERLRARRGKPLLERPAPDSRHRRRGLAGERHVRRLRRPGPARRRHERVVAVLGGLRGADQPAGATARPRQAAVPEYGPLPPGGEQAAEPVPRRHAGRKPLLPVHSGLGLRDRPRLAGRIQAGTGDRPRDRPLDPLNRDCCFSEVMAHGHDHGHAGAGRGALATALVLVLGLLVAEVVFGIVAGSLALLADAGHMLTDAAALGLALFAATVSARPARGGWTFGFRRVAVVAAQTNGNAPLPGRGWIVYPAN